MDFVLTEEGTTSSRTASASILTTLASLYHDKHKSGSGNGSKKRSDANNDDDDEITVQHSDEEEGDSTNPAGNPLIDILKENIDNLGNILSNSLPRNEIENCYDSSKFIPLGSFRLKIVELIL